jgi:hypothetical protein
MKMTVTILGSKAKGKIGPAESQVVSGNILDTLYTSRFLIDATQLFVGGCGDERLDLNGLRLQLPPVFGGWISIVLADALGPRLWYRAGMDILEHALAMTNAVRRMYPQVQLCVHTDMHAIESDSKECGCAAIAQARAVVETLTKEWLDLISEPYRELIKANARELLESGYFLPSGTAAFVDKLVKAGVTKEVLGGNHTGLAFVVNDLEGKIYDRPGFYTWCEQNGLAPVTFFEYARWALRGTVRKLYPGDAAKLAFEAGDAFNMAVPLKICNPATLLIRRR